MPGYEWPPLPILDPQQAALILSQRLQEAWDALERERVSVLEGPFLRKELVDAWIKEYQAALDLFQSNVDANIREFLRVHLQPVYEQAVSDVTQSQMVWTLAHQQAMISLATDTYGDFLKRSNEAGRASQAMVRAVRQASRETIYRTATGTKTATQAGRDLADKLRTDYALDHVIYADGAIVPVSVYADMAARTKSAVAYNAGTLNAAQAQGVSFMEVFDGAGCGWTSHADPDKANGTVRSIEDCASFPIAHPRCSRSFGPRPDITNDKAAANAVPTPSASQQEDQASVDWVAASDKPRAAQVARDQRMQDRAQRFNSEPVSVGDTLDGLGLQPPNIDLEGS